MRTLACLLALAAASPARAFQVRDRLHDDCHERMVVKTLLDVGYLRPTDPGTPLTAQDRRFIDDGEVDMSRYPRDIYAAALVSGVRWNDTKGQGSFSMNHLATVHNDDGDQRAHCLRKKGEDGDAGNAAAIEDCKSFIREEFWYALGHLDQNGLPDGTREDVRIHSPFEGTIAYPLPSFYFHAGRAIHALEDSFTHMIRSEDFHEVLNVGNWVEQVQGDLVEKRDGHWHEKELDICSSRRPSEAALVDAATRASEELWAIMVARDPADPTKGLSHDAREAALESLFDRWLTLREGCNVDNAYCGSTVYHELVVGTPGHGPWSQDIPSSGCSHGGAGALALLGLGALLLRRRRAALALLPLAVLLAAPVAARAQLAPAPPSQPAPPEAPLAPQNAEPEAPPRHAVAEAPRLALAGMPLRGHFLARASFSLPENIAFAFAGGYQWAFERWDVGGVLEYNGPWFLWDAAGTRNWYPGAFNAYATGGWRVALGDRTGLRFGLSLGTTTLLFEKVSTSTFTTNPYLGFQLGEILWEREGGGGWSLCFADLALPFTQLRGWPFYYPQLRATFTWRF